jgi:hypothetical protein
MMTLRTHQSSVYQPREAAWQGCTLVVTARTGRSNLRSLPFQGFGRLDTQAISLISSGLKPGKANPETDP